MAANKYLDAGMEEKAKSHQNNGVELEAWMAFQVLSRRLGNLDSVLDDTQPQ